MLGFGLVDSGAFLSVTLETATVSSCQVHCMHVRTPAGFAGLGSCCALATAVLNPFGKGEDAACIAVW